MQYEQYEKWLFFIGFRLKKYEKYLIEKVFLILYYID